MPKRKSSGVLIEAPQPLDHLPETRDGRKPVGMKSKVTGAGNRVTDPHNLGDTVIAIVELRCRQTGHEATDDGLLYVESLKVTDFFVLDRERGGELLAEERQRTREAKGEPPLGDGAHEPFRGSEYTTTGDGIVMTPSERADAGLPPLPGEDDLAAARADREAHNEALAGRSNGVASPYASPYVDYFQISAKEIADRIRATTDRAFVLQVGEFEENNKNRSSVLAAVSKRSAELLDA